jgi:hypothetical protein
VSDFPFPLPAHLVPQLPPPARDGSHYIDVRVAGKWDGILVVDSRGMCVGVYDYRRIDEYPLPFQVSEIEAIRPACLYHRILAAYPLTLWTTALALCWIVSPLLLLLAGTAWLFAWAALPVFAAGSLVACALSAYVMYLSYREGGFPFLRLPTVLFGIAQIQTAVLLITVWLRS